MKQQIVGQLRRVEAKSAGQFMLRARGFLATHQWQEAAQCFLEVTRLEPDSFEAFGQLGMLFNRLSYYEEALVCLHKALQLKPGFPKLNLLVGAVLKNQHRFSEAAEYCRREIALSPDNADAHYNLGLALQSAGEVAGALGAYQAALELKPGYVDALLRRGSIFREQLEMTEAHRCFTDALLFEPDHPEAHWELAVTLLTLGDLSAGWRELEWRWQLKDFRSPRLTFQQPEWDGGPLEGRSIFLYPEQGFGDLIQFCRYVSLVCERGGKVILGCPAPLRTLMETVPGVAAVVTNPVHSPPFQVQAPLMSLPRILGTTLETVPALIPYLSCPRDDFKLGSTGRGRFRAGVVWAGDPAHRNDRRRSMPPEFLGPLLEIDDIEWHSLQVGSSRNALERAELAGHIVDSGSRLRDFGDTSQAIQQLDLVLSVDTAVAHLAGALGKRVWLLVPFAPEWRWMLDRTDSPWYPSMKLFRQATPGDWAGLISRVRQELQRHIASQPRQRPMPCVF